MFSNKVSGFLFIAAIVSVSLFAFSFLYGSDSAIAGQASRTLVGCYGETDGGGDYYLEGKYLDTDGFYKLQEWHKE